MNGFALVRVGGIRGRFWVPCLGCERLLRRFEALTELVIVFFGAEVEFGSIFDDTSDRVVNTKNQ